MSYFESIKALSDIYLEDSYVLEIRQRGSEIEFEMEFVLRTGHILYESPRIDEMYCYRRGILRLSNCDDVRMLKSVKANEDASGEIDLGNIDRFDLDGERIEMSGDWGELSLKSNQITVFIAF